jgi:hypothetical protein
VVTDSFASSSGSWTVTATNEGDSEGGLSAHAICMNTEPHQGNLSPANKSGHSAKKGK